MNDPKIENVIKTVENDIDKMFMEAAQGRMGKYTSVLSIDSHLPQNTDERNEIINDILEDLKQRIGDYKIKRLPDETLEKKRQMTISKIMEKIEAVYMLAKNNDPRTIHQLATMITLEKKPYDEILIASFLNKKMNIDEWIQVNKSEATKHWNDGEEIKFIWSKKPEGIIIDKFKIGAFFHKDPKSISFGDVIKSGYPYPDLKIFIKNKKSVSSNLSQFHKEAKKKPSIFTHTIYRLPTKDELIEVDSYNLSPDEIVNGFFYTIVGRGILRRDNKNMIIESIKALYKMFPGKYEETLNKAKNL